MQGFTRLSDEVWNSMSPPDRADWTYVYLADRDGDVRDSGRVLVEEPAVDAPWEWETSDSDSVGSEGGSDEDEEEEGEDDQDDGGGSEGDENHGAGWFFEVVPNPAFGQMHLGLRGDVDAGVHARVTVHDVHGRVVRVLHDGELPLQVLVLPWDATDAHGRPVSTGVYYFRLEAGQRTLTR
jgi:hypothetical protein